MSTGLKEAHSAAQRYIGKAEPLKLLGWGVSGHVFLSPDYTQALKVHKHRESFETELRAYQLLKRRGVRELLGLTVPQLHGFDQRGLLIAMDFVQPPFLLDFAGVRFDKPDFHDDVVATNRETLEEFFGEDVSLVYSVYHELRKLGIYYLDFRPSNLKLERTPGPQDG